MSLRLDWVDYKAALYACEHWHYSKRLSKAANNYIGVWEEGKFIGCIVFGIGATNNIGRPYNLTNQECIELTRVALANHKTPVTQIIKIALKLLKKKNPGLKLIVSYADSEQDHYGGIYQAGNWIYTGFSQDDNIVVNGIREHRRTLGSRYGTNSLEWIRKHVDPSAKRVHTQPKFKYLYPLTDDMRLKIEPLRKPYPKKSALVVHPVRTSGDQPGEGGSIPTPTHRETKQVSE